jgi:hypothetical protein
MTVNILVILGSCRYHHHHHHHLSLIHGLRYTKRITVNSWKFMCSVIHWIDYFYRELFNDAFPYQDSVFECTITYERWIWKQAVVAYFRYYSGICLEELRKANKNLGRDSRHPYRCSNRTPPESHLQTVNSSCVTMFNKYVFIEMGCCNSKFLLWLRQLKSESLHILLFLFL